MASTNKTTNYELSQFIETDRPAWLTDYNGDMRTIDSTMKAISDVASGASGSISELADRMSTAEGNITTNTNDIATLDARADSLEAQAQSTAGTIANIQTEQTAQNLGIEAATELGYNLARPYDSASTYAVGAYVLFQNTLYKCITAISTGEAFDPTKWLAIKATDEINSGGGASFTFTHVNGFPGEGGDGVFIDNPTTATIYDETDNTHKTISTLKTSYCYLDLYTLGDLNIGFLEIPVNFGSQTYTADHRYSITASCPILSNTTGGDILLSLNNLRSLEQRSSIDGYTPNTLSYSLQDNLINVGYTLVPVSTITKSSLTFRGWFIANT